MKTMLVRNMSLILLLSLNSSIQAQDRNQASRSEREAHNEKRLRFLCDFLKKDCAPISSAYWINSEQYGVTFLSPPSLTWIPRTLPRGWKSLSSRSEGLSIEIRYLEGKALSEGNLSEYLRTELQSSYSLGGPGQGDVTWSGTSSRSVSASGEGWEWYFTAHENQKRSDLNLENNMREGSLFLKAGIGRLGTYIVFFRADPPSIWSETDAQSWWFFHFHLN